MNVLLLVLFYSHTVSFPYITIVSMASAITNKYDEGVH